MKSGNKFFSNSKNSITASGVVSCDCPKKSSCTSSILQIIFYFWSIEFSGSILRIQVIGLISVFLLADLLKLKIRVSFLAFIASSFRVTEENLVFETVQSGSTFECFLCS